MRRRRSIAILCLTLLLACASDKAAQIEPTPAPTSAPEQTPEPTEEPTPEAVVVIETPGAEEVTYVEPTLPPLPTPTPTPEPTPTPPPLAGVKIGLDPGHQARADHSTEQNAPDSDAYKQKVSSGTRGIVSGVYEYEVNLKVALKLKALLEKAGATVAITRTVNEVNLSNRERAEFFNEQEVDLAIRIHCNGVDDANVRGAFMLLPTKDRTSYYNENVRAATLIIEEYCAATGLSMRKQNGIQYSDSQTGFNWCTRPIVCIEMGHMSNETEDLLLTSEAFQDKMALGIYRGVLACFRPEQASEGGNP